MSFDPIFFTSNTSSPLLYNPNSFKESSFYTVSETERKTVEEFLNTSDSEIFSKGINGSIIEFWKFHCAMNKDTSDLIDYEYSYFKMHTLKDNPDLLIRLLLKPNFGGLQRKAMLERTLFYMLLEFSFISPKKLNDPASLDYLTHTHNTIVHLIASQLQKLSITSEDSFFVTPSELFQKQKMENVNEGTTFPETQIACCKVNNRYLAKIFSKKQGNFIPFPLNPQHTRFVVYDLSRKQTCQSQSLLYSIHQLPGDFFVAKEATIQLREVLPEIASDSKTQLGNMQFLMKAAKMVQAVKKSEESNLYRVHVLSFQPDQKNSGEGEGVSFFFQYDDSNNEISKFEIQSDVDVHMLHELGIDFKTHAQTMLPAWTQDMRSNKSQFSQSQIIFADSVQDKLSVRVCLLEDILKEEKQKPGTFALLINWIAQESGLEVSEAELAQVKDISGGLIETENGLELSPLATATILLNQARGELEAYDSTDVVSEAETTTIDPSLFHEDQLQKAKLEEALSHPSQNNNSVQFTPEELLHAKKLEKEQKRAEFKHKQKEEEFRKLKIEKSQLKEGAVAETKPQLSTRVQKQVEGVLQGVRQKAKKFNRMLLNLARKQQQELQGNSSSMNTKGSHMNIHLQKSDGTSGGFTVVNKHGKVKDKVINPRAQKGMLEKALFSTSKPKKK